MHLPYENGTVTADSARLGEKGRVAKVVMSTFFPRTCQIATEHIELVGMFLRTRSTTTRDSNLQFRGAVSIVVFFADFSLVDFPLFSWFSVI